MQHVNVAWNFKKVRELTLRAIADAQKAMKTEFARKRPDSDKGWEALEGRKARIDDAMAVKCLGADAIAEKCLSMCVFEYGVPGGPTALRPLFGRDDEELLPHYDHHDYVDDVHAEDSLIGDTYSRKHLEEKYFQYDSDDEE